MCLGTRAVCVFVCVHDCRCTCVYTRVLCGCVGACTCVFARTHVCTQCPGASLTRARGHAGALGSLSPGGSRATQSQRDLLSGHLRSTVERFLGPPSSATPISAFTLVSSVETPSTTLAGTRMVLTSGWGLSELLHTGALWLLLPEPASHELPSPHPSTPQRKSWRGLGSDATEPPPWDQRRRQTVPCAVTGARSRPAAGPLPSPHCQTLKAQQDHTVAAPWVLSFLSWFKPFIPCAGACGIPRNASGNLRAEAGDGALRPEGLVVHEPQQASVLGGVEQLRLEAEAGWKEGLGLASAPPSLALHSPQVSPALPPTRPYLLHTQPYLHTPPYLLQTRPYLLHSRPYLLPNSTLLSPQNSALHSPQLGPASP